MQRHASYQKSNGISTGVLLIGLGILAFMEAWWPGILIVLGVSLGLRQYLLGHYYDMGLSLLIFFGLFIFLIFQLSFGLFLPIFLGLAGLYIIFREFFLPEPESEIELEEELEMEIEEKDELS